MAQRVSYFKGFMLISFKGISMLFFLGCSAFVLAHFAAKTAHPAIIFAFCYPLITIAAFVYYGRQMYYFGIAEKQLIIRNTLFFWLSGNVPLSSINSIRIDMSRIARSKYYTPYYLRIYFDYPKTKKFYAATLSGKKWSQLTEALEQEGVRVVNQCPYIPFRDML